VTDNPPTETLVFNGIDGASGTYLLPEMTPADLSALAQGYSIERDEKLELDDRADKMRSGGHFGIEADARKLDETGWGVVLPSIPIPPSWKLSNRCSICARGRLVNGLRYSAVRKATAR